MRDQKNGSSRAAKASGSAHPASGENVIVLLRLAAGGATNREIAQQLGCSERTVKRRIEHLATRLRARNRTQVIAIAIREGLI